MIHFINENNELKHRVFPLPEGIKKHLKSVLKNYTGDKTVDGYKRLNNILSMNAIKYNEMKRIKNFFDHYNGTDKSTEYTLNGGDEMKLWVDNTLGSATKAIKDDKQAKKDAGIQNAFIKSHEKDRQNRKGKPTVSKVKTNDLGKGIMNNNDIKYESKTIILTKEQCMSINEAKDDTFNLKELESLTSFAKRKRYCIQHLGNPIGRGSSRLVFQIDDEKVLKLAYNRKGIAQNNVENDYYLYQTGITPKIFYSNDDDTLLISEFVLPAKKEDFIKVEGISWDEFLKFIKAEDIFRNSRNYKDGYRYISKERYEELINENELCSRFSDYIGNYRVPVGDMLRIVNYGLVSRDGEVSIVLLDSGFNDEVSRNYYQKR